MNRRDLVAYTRQALYEENAKQLVALPKRTFTITDNDGNSCVFEVNQSRKEISYGSNDINKILSALLTSVERALGRGEKVHIQGFGTFAPRRRAARRAKNPQTGEDIVIPAHHSPKFFPGKDLQAAVRAWGASQKDGGS
jgi:DNA-binding protein HU-beta